MIKLVKKYLKLLDRLVYTFLEDLQSFRNKLIFLTAFFCFLGIKKGNGTIVSAVFVCWSAILGFYMQKRSESEKNGHINKSKYDEVSRIDTEESYQNND